MMRHWHHALSLMSAHGLCLPALLRQGRPGFLTLQFFSFPFFVPLCLYISPLAFVLLLSFLYFVKYFCHLGQRRILFSRNHFRFCFLAAMLLPSPGTFGFATKTGRCTFMQQPKFVSPCRICFPQASSSTPAGARSGTSSASWYAIWRDKCSLFMILSTRSRVKYQFITSATATPTPVSIMRNTE